MDVSAEQTYEVINAVIDNFIQLSSDKQRSESREAFVFIDNQVNQYKDQLVEADEKLKLFSSQNFDGRDTDVDGNINRLRQQIQELKMGINERATEVTALKNQLRSESEYLSKEQAKKTF